MTQEVAGEEFVPLQKIVYSGQVSGAFARIVCTQHYLHQGKGPVEAVYVFPLPEESSVIGCTIAVGQKRIEAELKERQQARQEYDAAVAAGHHASLLEQKRPNVFRLNVGGIEPGEEVVVTTTYLQRVPWQNDGGRLTIPLVVAPRFIPGNPTETKTGNGWSDNTDEVPDASEITPVVNKEGVPYTAAIKISLQPGFPCGITSPSHGTLIGRKRTFDGKPVEISLTGLTPDRDFVLCYKCRSTQIAIACHRGSFGGSDYAEIAVIPPLQTVQKPKDVLLLLDVSGSMAGAKLDGLKQVAEKVAERLKRENPDNRVGLVAFESSVHPLQPLSKVSEETLAAIRSLRPMGSTYAGRAIDYAMGELSREPSTRGKYILLVSDGQTEDRWRSVAPGIRVIAVGIDAAVNTAYLRDIARETGGTSLFVYPGEDYDVLAGTLVGMLSGPLMREIKACRKDGQAVEAIGSQNAYLGAPAVVYLKGKNLPKQLVLVGKDASGQEMKLPVDLRVAGECEFVHQLWAREKLRERLEDKELVAISLEHGVLCSKTAFVAVLLKDVPGAKPERVEIPVALPHTWDYDKVFGRSGGDVMALAAMAGPSRHSVLGAPDDDLEGSLGFSGGVHTHRPIGGSPRRGRQLPTLPPPRGPVPSVTANGPVERLEKLVEGLEQGTLDRQEAEKEWKVLKSLLSADKVKAWSAVEKAKAYYLLVKLVAFGFTVSQVVMSAVSGKPNPADNEATDWWRKARRALGVAC